MFANHPLSFEYYGNGIDNGKIQDVPDLTQNVEKDLLAEELKMSCTNVMLQCLDTESRCIFILGTMFKIDSSILHNNPKDLTFKIVRDTRFSHDKSPYNPAFRVHISSKGKMPVPVG